MLSRTSPKIPSEVLSHWFTVVDGVHFSAEEFYAEVEAELRERRLPRLAISRIAFHEGGVVSDKRVYLRLARERYAFDVCAAPFGRGYFFSLRFVEKPRGGWLELLGYVTLGVLVYLYLAYIRLRYGPYNFLIATGIALALYGWWLHRSGRNTGFAPSAEEGGAPDFDGFFLNLPVIGEWYERWRKVTYYRHDTQLLFHTMVSEIVQAAVERNTAAKGVRLLRTYDHDPVLRELYRVTDKSLAAAGPSPA